MLPRLLAHVLESRCRRRRQRRPGECSTNPVEAKSWYVWIFRVIAIIATRARRPKPHEGGETLVLLASVLMCDGYSGYITSCRPFRVLLTAAGYVHREFIDIAISFPVLCGEVLEPSSGKLYPGIEKACQAPREGPLRGTPSPA
jgi:hypothetical protein